MPSRPPRRRWAGATTLGLTLIALGALGLLAAAGVDVPVDVPPGIVAPTLLIVLGGGIAVAGVRGEHDGGLIALAVLVGVLVLVGSVVTQVLDVPFAGGVGDRAYAPGSAAELDDEYRLLMGSLTVDLRDVEFPAGTTEVEVFVVMGELEVLLPDGVAAAVEADVGAGSAVVLGRTVHGLGVDNDGRTDGYDDADRRVTIRARVGLGEARV